jgi:hypothetical protein
MRASPSGMPLELSLRSRALAPQLQAQRLKPFPCAIVSARLEEAAEHSIRGRKTFLSGRLRCCVRRRERAGLAGPRSGQATILAAPKAPLFHDSRCFDQSVNLRTGAIA